MKLAVRQTLTASLVLTALCGAGFVAASGAGAEPATLSPASGSIVGGIDVDIASPQAKDIVDIQFGGVSGGTPTHPTDGHVRAFLPSSDDAKAGVVKVTAKLANGDTIDTGLTFEYRYSNQPVENQYRYAMKWWDASGGQKANLDEYGYLPGADCMNFVNQTLVARGWKMDERGGGWYMKRTRFDRSFAAYTAADSWMSSTAFNRWLHGNPALAQPLTDQADDRSRVKVGDVVQYDWQQGRLAGAGAKEIAGIEHTDAELPHAEHGDNRDHTVVVSRVVHNYQGTGKTKIYFAGHTNDRQYKDVDEGVDGDDPNHEQVHYWSVY